MHVFLTSYGGTHVEAMIPLIKELENRDIQYSYLALTIASVVAQKRGIKHSRISEFVSPNASNIEKYGRMLLEAHHNAGSGIQEEDSLAYLGSLLSDTAEIVGIDRALSMYRDSGLNAFTPVNTAKKILREVQPDWVVATASPRMEAAMLRAAVELGIPSLCMVDLFAILELPWLKNPNHAHWVSAYGPKTKERLVNAGRDANKILTLGYPAFDNLIDAQLERKAQNWRNEKGLSYDDIVVLWAEQPEPANPDLPRNIRKHLANICVKNNWKFVVRLHPASTDPMKEVIPNTAIVSHRDEELATVAYASNTVVTMTSTVAMEMLLLDKPAVILKGSQFDDMVDYSNSDGALIVDNIENLEDCLHRLFYDAVTEQQLAKAREKLPKPGSTSRKMVDFLVNKLDDTRKTISHFQ